MAAVERNLVLMAACPHDSQNDMTRSDSIKCFAAVPFAIVRSGTIAQGV